MDWLVLGVWESEIIHVRYKSSYHFLHLCASLTEMGAAYIFAHVVQKYMIAFLLV